MVLRGPERTTLTGVTAAQQTFSFTIGICATGQPVALPELIKTIENERYPTGFTLRRIAVVASECHESSLGLLREMRRSDPRVVLITEERRGGKASAINRIVEESEGDFLILVNADALPSPGSISRLLRAVGRDKDLGMVSAIPVVNPRAGIAARILGLMWATHNTTARDLSGTELSNHGTDELLAIRLEAFPPLPRGVVNDGAYMAGRVRKQGLEVRSIEGASVVVDVPSRPIEIIRQRRRILYGHLQVWRLVGSVPATAESLMLFSPGKGFGALVRTVSRRPSYILVLPFAAVGELVSFIGAAFDTVSGSERHTVWERYAD